MRTYIPKITECHPFLINCLGNFWGREYFDFFSEDINMVNEIKIGQYTILRKKGNDLNGFYGNFV